jgi:hypothetical protein
MKLAWLVTCVSLACAQIPVKRVVLYKNGVGYFEHQGPVQGKQDVTVSFTSGQLNDVLKSLTVLDLNGGRIAAIGYDASLPSDRKLNELRLPVGDKGALTDFLGAMRGARIEVRNGGLPLTGRLVSVERKTRSGAGATLEVDYVSLLTETGELRTAEVSPAFSVRLLEPGLASKLGKYLDVLAADRAADERKMLISADGTGARNLFVSYISEVPVWKATYRVVLGPKPLLQGWAIVDNTVGQDWENVSLSLVAGAPQSFVQNLSQPQYARRPVIALAETVNRAPQTFESGIVAGRARLAGKITDPAGTAIVDALVEVIDANNAAVRRGGTDANGEYSFAGLPEGDFRLVISKPGFSMVRLDGIGLQAGGVVRRDVSLQVGEVAAMAEVFAATPELNTESSSVQSRRSSTGRIQRVGVPPPPLVAAAATVAQARAQSEPIAQAQELGDLFEYKISQPVSIARNRSALVPIIQSPITVEKVSVWSQTTGGLPQRALWLTNSTNLTLDAGTFSVIEAEAFAGEGFLEPIRPSEKRLLSYATDLGVAVTTAFGSERQRVSRVVVSNGVITQHRAVNETRTYTIRNHDAEARTVLIEHPARAGYRLTNTVEPAEATGYVFRYRVPVPARQTVAFPVAETRTLPTTVTVGNLTSTDLVRFASEGSLNPEIEAALQQILARKSVVDNYANELSNLSAEEDRITSSQERLRENMKALKGSPEEKALVQRYTRQLEEQETRLAEIEKLEAALEAKSEKAEREWKEEIAKLRFDVTL